MSIEKEWLFTKYYDEGLSFQEIANLIDSNKQKVRRTFLKFGGTPRDKSTAQTAAITSGRAKHPTEGVKRSEETRLKISKKMETNWANLSNEELQRRSDVARENWEAMPEWKRDEIHKLAGQAVRETSKNGSKLENLIYNRLLALGYNIQYHVEDIVANMSLQVDMFVNSHRTAIEIDGPAHFLPIWGQEKLEKNMRADEEKNGLLMLSGFAIIRVKQLNDNVSLQKEHIIVERIIEELKKIELEFPTLDKRLIEIEV